MPMRRSRRSSPYWCPADTAGSLLSSSRAFSGEEAIEGWALLGWPHITLYCETIAHSCRIQRSEDIPHVPGPSDRTMTPWRIAPNRNLRKEWKRYSAGVSTAWLRPLINTLALSLALDSVGLGWAHERYHATYHPFSQRRGGPRSYHSHAGGTCTACQHPLHPPRKN